MEEKTYRDGGGEVNQLSAVFRLPWHCEGQLKLTAVVHIEVVVAGEVGVEDKLLGALSLGIEQHILEEGEEGRVKRCTA